ncbi:MAG: GldG family protein, partial [Microcystaceae cyanobacterium]
FLAFRYGGTIDLTENQLFTLSPQTETVIQQIREPVKIWVFDSQPAEGDKELLKNYQKMNNNLSFEFINPDQQPSLVKEFKVKSQGDVFVEYQKKKQQVQTLISFNQRQPLSESQLTNAIEKIQRDRPLNVYFLQGHGEHPLNSSKEGISEAVSSLENKGFTVNALNLGETPKIPENTNAIILAGPKRELLKSEVETLKTYSDRGGNLMVMVDAEAKPGLDPLLKPWGVSLDPRTVVDLSGAGELLGLGPATVIVTTYGQHPITQNFQNGLSLFPLSRAIATVKTPDVKAFTLLEASEKMVAKKELTEDLRIDEKQDLKGPFDLGVALERMVTVPQGEKVTAKMVVIGNALFMTNQWFNEQLNGDVFLNSVQWLTTGEEKTLTIRPRSAKNRRITLNVLQASVLVWSSLVIVPLLGIGGGIAVWWRRR